MIMQLISMYNHIIKPSEEGYSYMSEVMTNFYLLSSTEKVKACYQLLSFPNRTKEGLKVVDYLLMASEYRRDFSEWASDKGISIRYITLKNRELENRKTV